VYSTNGSPTTRATTQPHSRASESGKNRLPPAAAAVAQLIDVLIEAEAQLDFGRNSADVQRALQHLKALKPGDDLVRALQMKLVQLRMAEALARF
jgi:hypothetical protein